MITKLRKGSIYTTTTEAKVVEDVDVLVVGGGAAGVTAAIAAARAGADTVLLESTGSLGAEINALVAHEQRLEEARTWPYNTAMLRTLFVSVVIPGGAALARAAYDLFFP